MHFCFLNLFWKWIIFNLIVLITKCTRWLAGVHHGVVKTGLVVRQLENLFNSSDFRRGRVHTNKSRPIIRYDTSTDNIRTAVDSTDRDRDLQKLGKFFHFLNRGAGVYETALVRQARIRSDLGQDIIFLQIKYWTNVKCFEHLFF